MTAQEAREITKANIQMKLSIELSSVLKFIKDSAREGRMYAEVSILEKETKDRLIELGYSITSQQIGICEWTDLISWE
jgi:hypothetical protein